jgi:hypothetical protein
VIALESRFDHQAVTRVVSGTLATLMIQEVSRALDVPPIPHRRAQDIMRREQVSDEEPSRPPQN